MHPGLYEQVVNEEIGEELDVIPAQRRATAAIDKAEAPQVLAQYLASVAQKGLDDLADKGGDVSAQIGLVNQLIQTIEHTTQEADFAPLHVDSRAASCAFTEKRPDAGDGTHGQRIALA